jgi:hypothetical protein
LIGLLLILTMGFMAKEVGAQTTNITNLSYPTTRVLGGTAQVTFDLTYGGLSLSQGDVLVAFIWDTSISTYASGTVTSSPNACISLATLSQFSGKAVCGWLLASSSGIEHLTFELQVTTQVNSYSLVATAGVATTSGKAIMSSMSVQDFTIQTGNLAQLTVTAPSQVPITIDNSQAGMGSVSQQVDIGPHVVSVPDMVTIDNATRLKFQQWEDGSTDLTRTVDVEKDTTIQASYVTQYRLILESPTVNATGSGWYDQGSTAKISTSSSTPVAGFMGTLGATLQFKGWYENGELVLASSTGTIRMDSGHSLIAQWTTDYTTPIIVIVIVLAVVVGITAIAIRKIPSKT